MIKKYYSIFDEIPAVDLGGGITRKVLAYNDNLMITYWELSDTAKIEPHSHPHTQISVILEGEEEFIIGDETYVMKAGDTCIIPANVPHQVIVHKAIKAYDIFTPVREDILEKAGLK